MQHRVKIVTPKMSLLSTVSKRTTTTTNHVQVPTSKPNFSRMSYIEMVQVHSKMYNKNSHMVCISVMKRERIIADNTPIYSQIYGITSFLSGEMIIVNTMAHFPDLENTMYVISL